MRSRKTGRHAAIASALVMCGAAAAVFGAGQAGATFPGRNGKIAYSHGVGDHAQLFTMDRHGRHQHRLTHDSFDDSDPAFSPNGKWIAFSSSNGAGASDIWAVSLNGKHLRHVTHSGSDSSPSYSPGGNLIAFARGPDAIYIANADGTNERLVAHVPDTSVLSAAFSPKGDKIVYASWNDDGQVIGIVNADGTGLRELTHNRDADPGDPSFSPNAKQIVFDRRLKGDQFGISTMNVDGSHKRVLRAPCRHCNSTKPKFSPDGRKIVFDLRLPKKLEGVAVMRTDGTHVQRLAAASARPDWQALPR